MNTAITHRSRTRGLALTAMLGLLLTALLGVGTVLGAAPARAATAASPTTTAGVVADGRRPSTAANSYGDVVVGGAAALGMLVIAGAVIWFTARSRYLY